MAETVGQHSVAAFTSPVNGTSPIDANTVKGNDNTIRSAYVDHDADPGIHVQSSTLASRPVANSAGRKWMTQDSGVIRLFYDDGTNWYEVDYLRTTGGTISGNLSITGTLAVTGVATFTAQPILSSLTASRAVFTDGSKGLVSNAITGTGDVVMSASPTLTGTITAASATLSGTLGVSGLLTFASLKGTGATTVTNILDEDNMASDSATALATQQSIKAYVDAQVGASDALSEVLAIGNTTGANDIIVSAGQKIRTPAVAAQDGSSAITIANTTGALTLATALADSNLATISTAGKVSNSATTATDANTASAIVARDASGNFTAGTITAALTGNASTATTLQTARNINGVSFNGSADITVTAAAGTLTGTTLASNVTASSLTSVGTLANLTVTNPITGSVTGSSGSTTGNAATATALQTARNINGVSFNGTADITVTAAAGTLTGTTLASGVTASSLTSVGTLSSLTVSGNTIVGAEVFRNTATSFMRLDGGSGSGNGANIIAFGETHATAPGRIAMSAVGAGAIQMSTGGVLRATLDASGNLAVDTNVLYVDAVNNRVGIGTTGPEQTVDIRTTAVATPALQLSSSENSASALGRIQWRNTFAAAYPTVFAAVDAGIGAAGANPFIAFYTANTSLSGGTLSERMRLDASGRLGIGTTSPGYILDVRGPSGSFATLYGRNGATGASDGAQVLLGNSANFTNAFFRLNGGANSSQAGNGSLNIGVAESVPMAFYTNNTERARITSGGDVLINKTASDDTSAGFRFTTSNYASFVRSGGAPLYINRLTSDGDLFEFARDSSLKATLGITSNALTFGVNSSERARITSGGNLLVGTSSDIGYGSRFDSDGGSGVAAAFKTTAGSSEYLTRFWNTGTSGDNLFVWFGTEATGTGTTRGSITYNRGAGQVAYNVTSDERLKDNIADAKDSGALVDAMQVRQFDWKETGNHLDYGFVAQELHAIAPQAVTVPEDEDAMWSVDYSKLVPMLVKEIQSIRTRLAALES